MSMQSILSVGQSLTRMQTMQSAATKSQGRANVLRSEIKQDGENVTEGKKEELKVTEEKTAQIANDLMSGLTEVNKDLKPSEDEKPEGAKSEKEPITDKLELSANWKDRGADGESNITGISAGDPVIYKPEGGTIKVTPQISGDEPAAASLE